MEKVIIINNIGNRHLYYENLESNNNKLFNEKKNFRAFTENLIENFENEKNKIFLSGILKPTLEKYKNNIKKLILFVTNQDDVNYNNQDTIFAGEILKKLIENEYKIDVEILKTKKNPSDENSLVDFYQSYLKKINLENSKLIYLDAGGTPQQKFVTKLLTQELFSNYEIEYISNVEGNDFKVENFVKDTVNIEKIYFKKNIKKLIHLGYYDSAHDLLEKIEPKNKSLKYLQLAKFQLLNIQKNINFKDDIYIEPRNKKTQFITKYFFFNTGEPILCDEDLHIVNEHFLRAKLYLEKENYTAFIMSFQFGIEQLLIALICKYNDSNIDYKNIEKFLCYNKSYINPEKRKELPNQLDYCVQNLEKLNTCNEKIIKILTNLNSSYKSYILELSNFIHHDKHLDNLRNSIAHRGRTYQKEEIPNFIFENFNQLYLLIGLPNEYWKNLEKEIYNNLY
jgi:hypothetical protein